MKKHNFSAGPAILPASVMRQASEAVKELNGIGLSLIEISHRGKDFVAIMEEARQLAKETYGLGDDYESLYLQGGASTQFAMVPYNLLEEGKSAAYLDTGAWSSKAIKEAKLFGNVNIVASSGDKNYDYIPKTFEVPGDSQYMHITTNNTIYGTEIRKLDVFDTPLTDYNVPLVADMSSNIYSEEIEASAYDLIYAGAQKNLGPAGTTLVIIKKEMLDRVQRKMPSMLNYKVHIEKESMYNTPSVFAVYVCMLTLRWIKEIGGLKEIGARNARKAQKLYAEIDSNELFKGVAQTEDRSRMNVTFVLKNKDLESEFLKVAEEAGIVGIKGHRSVGGFRASLYNALEESSVDVLVDVMHEFGRKHG